MNKGWVIQMRRKVKQKKGFTLVELLLVVVILGIITGISIPLIRSISVRNEDKKYTTYMDSIMYSAKLYSNSYQEDLFGRRSSGCAIVSYQQMKEKGLLKDIPLDGVTCDTDQTYVKIIKMGDQYSYITTIGCGKKDSEGNVTISKQLPEGGIAGIDSCGVNSDTIMEFSGDPVPPDTSINFQSRKIRVLISSNTGFLGGMKIKYSFTLADNAKLDNLAQEPVLIGGWKDLKVDYPDFDQQINLIGKGEVVTTQSHDNIVTPAGLTDDVYVVLRIDELKDYGGYSWTNNMNEKYVYVGPYRVDGTKPVFGDSSTVISSESGYNSIEPKLKITASDPKFSPVGELRMCTSYDEDTCTKQAKYIKKKQRGYVTFDGNKVLSQIQNDYDGSEHTIYVTIGDAAGNYETKSFQYKIATRYILTYDSNGGNDCNPKTKTATFDSDTPKWGTLCSPTRDHYSFQGWNTKADGTGDTITANTEVTRSLTVYAQWKIDTHTITYVGNGNTGGNTATTTCDYGTSCTLRDNGFTKTNYHFTGWYTAATDGTKYGASTTLTSNITVYAHWALDTYTVTYNCTKNGGGDNSTSSIGVGKDIPLTNTCTKSGWTFVGWNTSDSATSAISSLKMGTSNVTLYGIYKKEAITITISFYKNNAQSQTNSSGTSVTDNYVTRSCTIAAVYNTATQSTTCNVTSPTISPGANKVVVGYNTSSSATTSSWNQTTAKDVSGAANYYAIIKNASVNCYHALDSCGDYYPYTAYWNAATQTFEGCSHYECEGTSPKANGKCRNSGWVNSGGLCCPSGFTYTFSGGCYSVIHYLNWCSQGTQTNGRCELYNQTSCPSGWTEF